MAGISAGVTNNNVGIAGIAGGGNGGSGASIMALQWYDYSSWTASDINETFTYATDNGAQIVNSSYQFDGWVGDPVVTAGLQYMQDNDVFHFMSAGNDNEFNSPNSAFEQSLLIASTTSTDERSGFSDYGPGIDISAPGSAVLSTTPGNTYASFSGTSMASPATAGTAALIWSENPTWSRDQVVAQLLATADNLDAQNPSMVGYLGTGRANSFQAVTADIGAPQVVLLEGLPADGSTTSNANLSTFEIDYSHYMDPATIANAANYELRNAGPDNVFGNADDILYPVSTSTDYMIGTDSITMDIAGGPLDSGEYQLTLNSSGLQNPFGTSLDGNGNGSAGGDFVWSFTIDPQPAGPELIGIDFDLGGGGNPNNWLSVGSASNGTYSNLSNESGAATLIDLTITESGGSWDSYAASINASTIPGHANSIANLDGQIYSGADSFVLTYSDLEPLAEYQIYVFAVEGFYSSIQQSVTIQGDGSAVSFNQNFNIGDLFINDQLGDSSLNLSDYAQVIVADASGEIEISLDPIGGTQDVVLGGIAIAAIGDSCEGYVQHDLGPTNRGVAVSDNATGSGYMLFTEESVHTRFGDMNPFNADHVVAVRLDGSQWQYNNNSIWQDFTPVATDRLVAEVDFSADTVTSLVGTDSTISGIVAGYTTGDLFIEANSWNGNFNAGEFGVSGTFIQVGDSGAETTVVGSTNRGVAVTDNATGAGYMMYSAESVHTRFGDVNVFNADSLVAVRLNGSQWQYNNNFIWQDFTPVATDRLLAEVDFSADSVTSLEGTESVISGIDSGYTTGDLVFTANMWNGSSNAGEFGVTGTFFTDGEDCGSARPLIANNQGDSRPQIGDLSNYFGVSDIQNEKELAEVGSFDRENSVQAPTGLGDLANATAVTKRTDSLVDRVYGQIDSDELESLVDGFDLDSQFALYF